MKRRRSEKPAAGSDESPNRETTYEAKIKDEGVYPALAAISDHLNHAQGHLFVDRYVRGRSIVALKRTYLIRFGLTARQFNSISYDLAGKVESSRKSATGQVRRLTARTTRLRQYIAGLEKRIAGQTRPDRREKLRFLLHQKKRHLAILEERLSAAQEAARRPLPRICFGGRKLFRAQFHLTANDYRSHDEWVQDWRAARSGQFLCLGSGDETSGNQTATLIPVDGDPPTWDLRLRVPPALEGQYGRWIFIRGVQFRYGQEVIDHALKSGQAITLRFLRRERKGEWVWYVQATTERPDAPIVTSRDRGALGVDFNPGVVASGRIDRCGNPTSTREFPANLEGKARVQKEAILGDLVADIVAWAKSEGVPIVIEKLDFERKKARLREMGKEYARMLSAFCLPEVPPDAVLPRPEGGRGGHRGGSGLHDRDWIR